MPERKGGSYVVRDGQLELKHRTKPATRKPKGTAATNQDTKAPAKTTKAAGKKKESGDADA